MVIVFMHSGAYLYRIDWNSKLHVLTNSSSDLYVSWNTEAAATSRAKSVINLYVTLLWWLVDIVTAPDSKVSPGSLVASGRWFVLASLVITMSKG